MVGGLLQASHGAGQLGGRHPSIRCGEGQACAEDLKFVMPITILDIVLLGVMLVSALLAMIRGFMREILSIAAWVIAAGATLYFYAKLLPFAKSYFNNDIIAAAVVVGGTFLATLLIVSVLTIRVSDIVLDSRVGALDRTLGFLFGLARGLIIVVVAFLFFAWLVPDRSQPEWVRSAKSRVVLQGTGDWLMSMLPDDPESTILKRLKKPKPEEEEPQKMTETPADAVLDLDGDRLREECGVFGIFGHPDAAAITALGLHALQHRGQEAAGIVTFDGKRFHSERRLGLVGDNFSGREVYDVRKTMGAQLAREAPAAADVVIPVPDSGVPAAIGYAQESGIPYELGIIRNHYVGRTFIEPSQQIRQLGVRLKHSANRAVVSGKRIVLIDDSIVRGTTSTKIVQMMREAGAKEVHFRISSPPITHPDYYGIDTPERDKLLAATHDLEGMRKFIGADSLAFLSVDGIYRAMGEKGRDPVRPQFTDHCFTGDYPTPLTDRTAQDTDPRQLSLLAEAS